jgi:hypothetical protein
METYYPFIAGLGAMYRHLIFSRFLPRYNVGYECISGYYKFKPLRYKSSWNLNLFVFEELIFSENLEVPGRTYF